MLYQSPSFFSRPIIQSFQSFLLFVFKVHISAPQRTTHIKLFFIRSSVSGQTCLWSIFSLLKAALPTLIQGWSIFYPVIHHVLRISKTQVSNFSYTLVPYGLHSSNLHPCSHEISPFTLKKMFSCVSVLDISMVIITSSLGIFSINFNSPACFNHLQCHADKGNNTGPVTRNSC